MSGPAAILASMGHLTIDFVFTAIMVALIIYATSYYVQALGTLLRRRDESPSKPLTVYPSVSVIVPMHNEAVVLPNTMRALSMIDYPSSRLEVIAVDDGSTDGTGQMLEGRVDSFPFSLRVIHRDGKRRGKSAALNDGIRASSGEMIVIFDADHIAEPGCVKLLVSRLAESGPRVGAVQGRTSYINEDENFITKMIARDRDPNLLAYLRAQMSIGLPIFTAGSTVAFRRSVFSEVGLFNEESVTEDTDFSVKMYLNGFTVKPELVARSYEEAIDNFSAWRRRTYRWTRGHNRAFFSYWRQVLTSRYLSIPKKLYLEIHLAYYSIPTLIMAGMVIYALSLFVPLHAFFINWSPLSWLELSVWYFAYCFFALPTLLLVGTHLSGRPLRDAWIFVLYTPKAFVDVWTCTRGFTDEILRRKYVWAKTPRSGVVSKKAAVEWLLPPPGGA